MRVTGKQDLIRDTDKRSHRKKNFLDDLCL